jgi:hypothetical protein
MNKKTAKDYLFDQYMVLIGIIIAVLALIYSYCEPDIRYSSLDLKPKLVDSKIINNNEVYLYSLTPKFKNLSIKQGHVSKVEIVPISLEAIYDIKILSIRTVSLVRNQEEQIEVQFLVTIPVETGMAIRKHKLSPKVILNAYDNNGIIIEKNIVNKSNPFTRMVFILNEKK